MSINRIPAFSAFFLIPFLGGNHLTLLHVIIDRFWIETSFLLFLVAAIVPVCYKHLGTRAGISRFLMFFGPLFVLSAASLTYTWSTFNTLNEINVLLWAAAATFLFCLAPRREDLLTALVAGTAFSALCAIWQALVLFPSLLETFRHGGYAAMLKEQSVPFSSFLNQNMLGGYCASILPLALYFAFVRKERCHFVTTGLIITGLLLSVSRLAMLACIPSCALVAFLIYRERGPRGLVPLALVALLSAGLVAGIVYGPKSAPGGGIRATLEGKVQRSYTEAATLNFRTDIWGTAIKALGGDPLFGYGAGAFVYPYQKYYEGKRYTRVAHGTFAKIGVELGMAGILCLLWYLFGLARGVKTLLNDRTRLIAGLSALAAFLFGLFDFAFDTAAHVITFFVLSSVCFIPIISGSACPSRRRLAPLLLIVPILVSFVYTARADSSRRFVEDARLLSELGAVRLAYQSLSGAVEAMTWNNEAWIELIGMTTASFLAEKNPEARELLRNELLSLLDQVSQRRDKDAELLFTLAAARNALGDGLDSCMLMKRALRFQPSSASYALGSATCFVQHGQMDQALSIIRSMDVYFPNYRRWGYPDGLLVYRLKDLEAEIEYRRGHGERALALMRANIEAAQEGRFVTSDWRSRQSVPRQIVVSQLERRLQSLEERVQRDRGEEK